MKSKELESTKINIDKKRSSFPKTNVNNTKKTIQRKNPKQTQTQKNPMNIQKNEINKNVQNLVSPASVYEEKISDLNAHEKLIDYKKSINQDSNNSKESTKIDSALISSKFKNQVNILNKSLIKSHSSKDISQILKNAKECSNAFVNLISKVKNILSMGLKNPYVFIHDEIEKIERLKKVQEQLDEFINNDNTLFNQKKFIEISKFIYPTINIKAENNNNINLVFYEIQEFYQQAKDLKIQLGNGLLSNKSLKNSISLDDLKKGDSYKIKSLQTAKKLLEEEKTSIINRSEKRIEIYKRFFLVSSDCIKDISRVIKKEMKKKIDKKDKEKIKQEIKDKIFSPTFKLLNNNSKSNDVGKTRNHNFGNTNVNIPSLEKEFNLSKNEKAQDVDHHYVGKNQLTTNFLTEKTIVIEPYRIDLKGKIKSIFFPNKDTQSSFNSSKLENKIPDVKKVTFNQNSNEENEKSNNPLLYNDNTIKKRNSFNELAVTNEIITFGGECKKQAYENKSINCNISNSLIEMNYTNKVNDRKNEISDTDSSINNNQAIISNLDHPLNIKYNNLNINNEMYPIFSKANHNFLADENYSCRIGKESVELINFSQKRDEEIYFKIDKLKDKFCTLHSNDEKTIETPVKKDDYYNKILLDSNKKITKKTGEENDKHKKGNLNRSFVTLKSSKLEEDTFLKSESHFINYIPDSIVKKVNFQSNKKSYFKKYFQKESNLNDETLILYDPKPKGGNKRYMKYKEKINLSSCCSNSGNIFFEAKSHFDTNRVKNKTSNFYKSNIQISLNHNHSMNEKDVSNQNENKSSCRVI